MDLLIDAGYEYMGNGLADDLPHYWVTDFASRRALLTLPYYYHFDDQWFLLFPRRGTGLEHADDLFRNWRAEFNAQYKRGRQFSMVLHPGMVGWAHRRQLLEDFLAQVKKEHVANHFTFAELEENEVDLEKLRNWFARIRQRDAFGASGRPAAEKGLETCQQALDEYAARVYAVDEEGH